MGLLQVINDAPGYAKIGLQGPQGSGKSMTATNIACVLHREFKSKKPIAFFDTESGSDYLKDLIEERTGMPPLRVKARAFSQLMEVMRECRAGASDILIVDSITHVWREIQAAYMKRVNEGLRWEKTRMDIQDIMQIKKQWEPWPDEYLTSPLHVLVCGREGNEWGHEEDAETGKRELVAVGKKMKVEGEFGYESSLIISMHTEQIARKTIRDKKKKSTSREPTTIINIATVLKDRFDVMNGAVFEMPTGEEFLPFIQKLQPSSHGAVDTAEHSTSVLPEMDGGYMRAKTDREIVVEKIQGELVLLYPGQTAAEKKHKVEALKRFFGTTSWADIQKRVSLSHLTEGLAELQAFAAEQAYVASEEDADGKVETEAAFA